MLNLDMVGHLEERQLIGDGPLDVLTPLYEKYPFAEKITVTQDTGNSDHASWLKAGVPAVFLHTGTKNSEYHKTTDDAKTLNFKGMAEVVPYALDIIQGVDRKLSPATINSYILH
jgi:Zn-dependent M28 family amino/carboxypeptidase